MTKTTVLNKAITLYGHETKETIRVANLLYKWHISPLAVAIGMYAKSKRRDIKYKIFEGLLSGSLVLAFVYLLTISFIK